MLIKGRQRNVRISSNMDYNRYNSKLNQALIIIIIIILEVCKIIIRKNRFPVCFAQFKSAPNCIQRVKKKQWFCSQLRFHESFVCSL